MLSVGTIRANRAIAFLRRCFAYPGVCAKEVFLLPKFLATIFAVAMLLTGPATMAIPQCQATTDFDYWVDGYHCVDGTQSNCTQTHKCFSSDGTLTDCFNYTYNQPC